MERQFPWEASEVETHITTKKWVRRRLKLAFHATPRALALPFSVSYSAFPLACLHPTEEGPVTLGGRQYGRPGGVIHTTPVYSIWRRFQEPDIWGCGGFYFYINFSGAVVRD